MARCTNCNNELPNGTRFCGVCGQPVTQAQPQPQQPSNEYAGCRPDGGGHVHCPQCRSKNITTVSENAGNTQHGSIFTYSRTYWVCSDCGKKFRNIDDLEREISKMKIVPIYFLIGGVIALFIFLKLLPLLRFTSLAFLPLIPIALGVYTGFIKAWLQYKRNKDMEKDLEYLKHNSMDW